VRGKKTSKPCSIVITNYNGKELLRECLPSVVEAARRHDAGDEIIVVDDCSGDGSVRMLHREFPSVRVVANPVNLGFQKASNLGVLVARFDIVVLLNNDILVEPAAIDCLCSYFDRFQGVFAVSAKLLGWDGRTFLAGRRIAVFEEGHFRLKDVDGDERKPRLTLFATGGAAAFDREKFLELGGFDHIYYPLYWEDIDICYRAHKRGWLVIYAPDCVMYHKHRATIGKSLPQERLRLVTARNSYIFLYKNITDPVMLKQHAVWSLLFFVRDTLRGKFRFQRAFLMALCKLPRIIRRRRSAAAGNLFSDRAVISAISSGQIRQRRP